MPVPVPTFDAAAHAYHAGGRRLPSVTQVLDAARITAPPDVAPDVLELARARGQAVHRAIELQHAGTLDPSTLDPRLEPYLFAWEAFVAAYGYVSHHVERHLYDANAGFAGTPDDLGTITKGRYQGARAVIDRKAVATVQPGTAVQLAAYRWLAQTHEMPATHRFAVQLFDDGTFRLHEYHDPMDIQEFRAALLLWHRRASRTKESPA